MSEKVLNLAKWIGGVFGGATAIASIVILIYTQGVKAEQKRTKSTNQVVRIDTWIKYDSIEHAEGKAFRSVMINNFKNFSDSLRTINRGVRRLSIINSNMQDYMERKVPTKEELQEVQRIFEVSEKKKNEMSFFWTPLLPER
jgi:hypothetical protein